MPFFSRYFGIDYSGAQTPRHRLKGLRLFAATVSEPPGEMGPPPGQGKYWSRRNLADWLVRELREDGPTLVGIDHAFSFPLAYFARHALPRSWPAFLEDFARHWPTDQDAVWVRDLRRQAQHPRLGDPAWLRLTETRCRPAKSVFRFGVHGEVASSTHAGLPWLLFLRRQLGERIFFWPFDGWNPPPGRSVLAEVYPSLWHRTFPREDRDPHQQDAYSVARWLRETDAAEGLSGYFQPTLTKDEAAQARLEGWILGAA